MYDSWACLLSTSVNVIHQFSVPYYSTLSKLQVLSRGCIGGRLSLSPFSPHPCSRSLGTLNYVGFLSIVSRTRGSSRTRNPPHSRSADSVELVPGYISAFSILLILDRIADSGFREVNKFVGLVDLTKVSHDDAPPSPVTCPCRHGPSLRAKLISSNVYLPATVAGVKLGGKRMAINSISCHPLVLTLNMAAKSSVRFGLRRTGCF